MSIFPTDRADRTKVFIVVGIVGVTFLWISYYLLANMEWHRTPKNPSGPGYTASHELTEKITAEQAFADVGVSVLAERPLKLSINGAVYSEGDMDKLTELLHQLRPQSDYEMHVEVLKH